MESAKKTPLMQQYYDIKCEYSDTLLFFQVGDFYELFFDDAKQASAFLSITLTKRGKNNGEPIPLCGVPVHAIDHYLIKLIRGGFKVAVVDQLTEARPGTVVERGVTRVLTPGTLTDSNLLDDKSASYLFSFFPVKDQCGLLFGELLTAQLFATILPSNNDKKLASELVRFFPDEILIPDEKQGRLFVPFFKRLGYFTSLLNEDAFSTNSFGDTQHWAQQQFDKKVYEQFSKNNSLLSALTLFHSYLQKNQKQALDQFTSVHFYQPDDFLMLDGPTQRNLELVKNVHDGSRKNTLLSVIDRAATGMGSRMIKKWLLRPLVKKEAIIQRQDAIEKYIKDDSLSQKTNELLKQIGDVERVVGRIALHRANVTDYKVLLHVLSLLPDLHNTLAQRSDVALLQIIAACIADFSKLQKLLTSALSLDSNKEWIIAPGFDQEFDRIRIILQKGSANIIEFERREQQKTGINSLKVRYNRVHGYYIEVTKANKAAVPEHYMQQQSLVGRDRFITPELQQLQHDLFCARNEIEQLEKTIFDRVKLEVTQYITQLRKCAHALAHLDALFGLAQVAYDNRYVRPVFNDGRDIVIQEGRHPVVEFCLQGQFIPNDTTLTDEQSLWVITGPNMGGKSTYLRQVALISILSQIGSFVPAKSAHVSILDRLFTRIGAGDNLADGKSTFLVEMEETAAICSQATSKSLVILDEVGRGTSTFDGLAIAQAVVEYLYKHVQARCLFATHYHELTSLSKEYPGIVSYYAASKKTKDGILFLYQIIKGVADGSFGIEVAKIVDLPAGVIARAQQIVQTLSVQGGSFDHSAGDMTNSIGQSDDLMNHYENVLQQNQELKKQMLVLHEKIKTNEVLLDQFKKIDYDMLSPKKAFDLLWDYKEKI